MDRIVFDASSGLILEYQVDPGVYYVVVKSLGSIDLDVEGVAVESVEDLTGVELVTVRADRPSELRLVLRSENRPALVLLLRESIKSTEQGEIIGKLASQLQRRAQEVLGRLPGSVEFNTTLTIRGGRSWRYQ